MCKMFIVAKRDYAIYTSRFASYESTLTNDQILEKITFRTYGRE